MSEVRLSEIIAALSHALDLTEGQPPGHAERTCALGMRLAADTGLPEEQRSALFYALLLKDAGCSSSSARMAMLFGTDDIELKRLGKAVDWQSPVEALRFAAATVAQGEPRHVRARRFLQVVPRLKDEAGAIVGARCDRGAQIVLRLAFPPDLGMAFLVFLVHWPHWIQFSTTFVGVAFVHSRWLPWRFEIHDDGVRMLFPFGRQLFLSRSVATVRVDMVGAMVYNDRHGQQLVRLPVEGRHPVPTRPGIVAARRVPEPGLHRHLTRVPRTGVGAARTGRAAERLGRATTRGTRRRRRGR